MHICDGKSIELQFGFEELEQAAELLKVFADATRIKIMAAMYGGEQAVCDIAKTAALSHSLTSHQLAVMKKFGLVKSVKHGRHSLYSLNDDCIESIIQVTIKHIRHKREKA